jgi:imidazoleglycerol-phosphate dehydratase
MTRTAEMTRKTKETGITARLSLDGTSELSVRTGIPFFDHMLTAMFFHGGIALELKCEGDIEVDSHHTVEDVGLVLGELLRRALGDLEGIERFGEAHVPMDDALVRAVVDISGRPCLAMDHAFTVERIGTLETETIHEFMRAFSTKAMINLHIDVIRGTNNHHVAEAVFKATGRALGKAVRQTRSGVPSTKGVL